ncbi:SprT-like domain-containing protein [Spiroplasma endosymbiont of Cantharis rufa]|uniref:SprT-like domain-containing protein n=1 Tax=Spiroplasma endosymbiont of Cantharis rufa TaxID=3066279 RepID=UPI0030CBC08D
MKYRIDDLILELHSIHNQLNKFLFSNTLSQVKINIETSKRKSRLTLGHFDTAKDWSDELNQITIWTLALNGNYLNIIGVLVHEMVHQYNFERNIKDVENNQRHNKHFKKTCEEVAMLTVVKNSRRGFSSTSPTLDLINYIENQLDFNKDLFKSLMHKDAINYQPKGYNKSNKYLCKGCDTIINNSREVALNIKCMDCNIMFQIL